MTAEEPNAAPPPGVPRPAIRIAGSEAAPLLSAVHAEAFAADARWGPEAIALLLALPGHFAFLAATEAEPAGFLLGRVAAEEAEVLTLAVRPGWRRQGVARRLLAACTAEVVRRGACRIFLEVSEANAPARALYAALGAQPAGRRRCYYPDGTDALLLRLDLTPSCG